MTGKKSKKYIIFFIVIISLVVFGAKTSVAAKEAEFTLIADSLNLETGVSTNLTVSMINAQGAEVTGIAGIESFDVISSSQSASTQIVNNNVTNKKEINYVIMPKTTGEFTLQANIKYNGMEYKTNELTVKVSENKKVDGEVRDLFLETKLSDSEIFFGQKIILSYELYTRYNIENYGFLDAISLNGFILNDVPEEKLKAGYVYLEDNKYARYEVRQMILSPVKTGSYTIPSYNFQVNVSTSGGFFSTSKPVYLQTDPLELTVKPLPAENQPAGFSGLVGKLKLESDYSKQEVEYGDSLTLKVKASGSCSLESLNKVIKNGIPGFTVYETEKNIEESIVNNQYHALKEFEIILVPEKTGNIDIKPILIPYFDPETETYEQAEIPGTTITVNGSIPEGDTVNHIQNSAPSLKETVLINQVSYSSQNEGYLTIQLKKQNLYIVLILIAAAIMAGVVAILVISQRKGQNRRVCECYKQLKNKNDPNEIYSILSNMIRECFGISLKASTRNGVADRLSVCGLAEPVLEIMDFMENGNAGKDAMFLKKKAREIYKRLRKLKHPQFV